MAFTPIDLETRRGVNPKGAGRHMFFSRKNQKTTKSTSHSVLKGQRPRKRTPGDMANASRSRKMPLNLGRIATVAMVAVGIYFLIKMVVNHRNDIDAFASLWPQNPTVTVESNDGTIFDEKTTKAIFDVVSKEMKIGSIVRFSAMGEALESLGTLENISIIRPQRGLLMIRAGLRKPLLLVSVGDHLRYLTIDGTVFGDANDGRPLPGQNRPTVTLSGLFEERGTNFVFDASSRLMVSAAERALLVQAIALYESVSRDQLSLTGISYQRFRGFTLKTTDNSEIVLGNTPFEHKLQKLKAIRDKLSSSGVTALRIELDYDGKAFVKERKL